MENSLVSIIIPVYNSEKYIEQTILSAINQTWQNKEIIIIDDGSSDKSLSICEKYASEQVKIYSQANNGASSARNSGLKIAKGDYIQFLDADDLLSPNKVENQIISLLKAPNKIAVCSTVHFTDEEQLEILMPNDYEESFLKDFNEPIEFLINIWGGNDGRGSMIQPNAWLAPMNIIKKAGLWNEKLSVDDDGEFFARVVINSNGIIKSINCKNYYRKHIQQNSLSKVFSIKGYTSLYRSALLKKELLLAINNNLRAKTAIANQFFDICLKTYQTCPRIFQLAERSLKDLNTNPNSQIVLGGKILQKITNIFGYKTAITLQHFKKSFLK